MFIGNNAPIKKSYSIFGVFLFMNFYKQQKFDSINYVINH